MKNIFLMPFLCIALSMNASSSNQETLNSYAQCVQEYIDRTPQEVSGTVKDWIDEVISYINKDLIVLECGSAFGRDADYFQKHGCIIQCTDAVPEFVAILQSKGFNARMCNILTDPLGNDYGLIFANAVFHHLTPEEFEYVLKKMHTCLSENGFIAFKIKSGIGSEWSVGKINIPRYFCYWQKESLMQLLQKTHFTVKSVKNDDTWIMVIAQKNNELLS